MKHVLALCVVLSIAMPAMALPGDVNGAGWTNGYWFGRAQEFDTLYGDVQGWRGVFNNSKGTGGSGGTIQYGGWQQGAAASGANAGLINFSRQDISDVIAAAPGVWDAYIMIGDRNNVGFTNLQFYTFVIGSTKIPDAMPENAFWIGGNDNSADPINTIDGITYDRNASSGRAGRVLGGTNYTWNAQAQMFDDYVVGAGHPYATYTAAGGGWSYLPNYYNGIGYVKIHIGQAALLTYLNDPSWDAMFGSAFGLSDAAYMQGHGGNQWSQGVGGISLLITPEPATLVLLALGGVALLRRRS